MKNIEKLMKNSGHYAKPGKCDVAQAAAMKNIEKPMKNSGH